VSVFGVSIHSIETQKIKPNGYLAEDPEFDPAQLEAFIPVSIGTKPLASIGPA
jgi:hypothetical protein